MKMRTDVKAVAIDTRSQRCRDPLPNVHLSVSGFATSSVYRPETGFERSFDERSAVFELEGSAIDYVRDTLEANGIRHGDYITTLPNPRTF